MRKKHLLKRILSAVMTAAILTSCPAEVFTASAMTRDADTDKTVKILSPVASEARNYEVTLDGLYNTITVYPDNTATGITAAGYGATNYVRSRSNQELMIKSTANVTNGVVSACTNYIMFPFDVWDASTGKMYKARTNIIFGTEYNSAGEAITPSTFIIPASTASTTASSPYNYVTYAVALNAYSLNLPALFKQPFLQTLLDIQPGLKSKTGRKTNASADQYMAWDQATIGVTSSVTKLEILSDSVLTDGYLHFGEGFGFKLYTSGAFSDDNCEIILTPKYTFLTAKDLRDIPDGTEASVYYYKRIGENSTLVKAGSAEDLNDVQSYVLNQLPYQPSADEKTVTDVLLNSAPSDPVSEEHTLAGIRLTPTSRMFRDITAEYRTAYERLSNYVDSNVDGIDDNLQRSQAVWYGTYYLPADAACIEANMKQGYCSTCNSTRWSADGKCPTHGRNLSSVKAVETDELQALMYYDRDDFLAKEGYVKISFDVTFTDSKGITNTVRDITITDKNGLPITLKYKLGTRAGDKYHIVYSH